VTGYLLVYIIVGLLSAVGNLRGDINCSTISLSWMAPFTLRLTIQSQNFINYCVSISTSQPQSLLMINETEYNFELPPKHGCDAHYNISVTPVNVVGGGEPSVIMLLQSLEGMFM
jgi:hypothetical protein